MESPARGPRMNTSADANRRDVVPVPRRGPRRVRRGPSIPQRNPPFRANLAIPLRGRGCAREVHGGVPPLRAGPPGLDSDSTGRRRGSRRQFRATLVGGVSAHYPHQVPSLLRSRARRPCTWNRQGPHRPGETWASHNPSRVPSGHPLVHARRPSYVYPRSSSSLASLGSRTRRTKAVLAHPPWRRSLIHPRDVLRTKALRLLAGWAEEQKSPGSGGG